MSVKNLSLLYITAAEAQFKNPGLEKHQHSVCRKLYSERLRHERKDAHGLSHTEQKQTSYNINYPPAGLMLLKMD